MPKISVIVPNYNHGRFLNQRIDSILNQTFQDFELILLDDCSTDNSRDILSSYASDPRVRLEFNEKNSGTPFKQWNKGVQIARGQYIWIAESDDYTAPRFLERLVPILEAEPNTAYAYCRSWRVFANGETPGFMDYYLKPLDLHHWTADHRADGREECRNFFARMNCVPNASAVVFRRAVFEQVGGADETLRLCGDWKLWASMALTGQIAYVAEPLNYFRFHEDTVRSKTVLTKRNVSESLDVISWIFRQVKPPQSVRQKIQRWQPEAWTPTLMSLRVAPDVKRRILHAVREIDPHPIRHAIRPALGTIRLKLRRHWRTLGTSIRPVRELSAWWLTKNPKSPTVGQLIAAIASVSAFERSATRENDSEAPIFLLSTGMRTGSTLLQRILVTDSRLFLWGEPMGEMTVVSRIAQMVSGSLSPGFQESWQRQPNPASSDLTKSWIAHLNPSADNFRLGLRTFFDTWLGCPARRNGFARWGFKEIRLDAADATLLYWLYPDSKFILLTRHPYDCYRSFTDAKWQEPSFMRHPDVPINSAASFAREWNRIAMSWSELPSDFPSMLIKYEDLVSGNFDFRNLESWLGLKLNESEALSEKVGRTAFRPRLHAYERWIVSREAAPGMRALGYSKKEA